MKLVLYEPERGAALSLPELSGYVRKMFPELGIEVRPPVFSGIFSKPEDKGFREKLLRELASLRVKDPLKWVPYRPFPGEMEYEGKMLRGETKSSPPYEGMMLLDVIRKFLPAKEKSFQHIHVVFTHRLITTFDEDDRRYHARAGLYSFPSLVSLTGIVEAPAKPREFYLKMQSGLPLDIVKEEFRGRYLDFNDPRTTEIMKGYLLQALLYHFTGLPFCENRECRFYNAHRQEELLRAQSARPEFCAVHRRLLPRLSKVASKEQ
ncbi:MAG TPA: DUF6775 family putative metallopeptidase [bacterium]|nr:DUF6775 family putative metallopeptidase [bacterium]